MSRLVESWRSEQADFATVLSRERLALGTTKVRMFFEALRDNAVASEKGDIQGMINCSGSKIMHEHAVLREFFQKAGLPRDAAMKQVIAFWRLLDVSKHPQQEWEANLFAALARRVGQGQRAFTRGVMNDITAISTYAPYVDAMFVDKEFEVVLTETPELRNLVKRAQIFSFKSTEKFLEYLTDCCERASAETRIFASRIYGIA